MMLRSLLHKKSSGHRHSQSKYHAEVESVEDSEDDYDSSSDEFTTVSDSRRSRPQAHSHPSSRYLSRSSVSFTPDVSSKSIISPSSLNIRLEEDDQLDEIDLKTQEKEKEILLLSQQRDEIDQARKLKLNKLTEFALKQIQENAKNTQSHHQTTSVEKNIAGDVVGLGGSRTTINNFLLSNEALQDVVNGVIANGRIPSTTRLNVKESNESQAHVNVQTAPVQETQNQPQVVVEQQPQLSQSQHLKAGNIQLKPQTIYVEQPIQPQQQQSQQQQQPQQQTPVPVVNDYQHVFVQQPQQQQQQPVQVQQQVSRRQPVQVQVQPQQQYQQQHISTVPAQPQPQQSYQQQPLQVQPQPVQVQTQQEYQQPVPTQPSQSQETQQQVGLQQPPTFQPEPQHHRQQSRVRFSYPLQQPSPVTLQRPPQRNSYQFPANRPTHSAMSSQSYESKQQQQQSPRSQFIIDSTGVPAYPYLASSGIPATPMQHSQPQPQQQQQPQFNDSLLSDNTGGFDYNPEIPVMISTPKVQNQFMPTAQSTPQTTAEQPQSQRRHQTIPILDTSRARLSRLRQQYQTTRESEKAKEGVEQPPHRHCALTCSCGGEYKHGVCQVCHKMLSTARSSSSARVRRGIGANANGWVNKRSSNQFFPDNEDDLVSSLDYVFSDDDQLNNEEVADGEDLTKLVAKYGNGRGDDVNGKVYDNGKGDLTAEKDKLLKLRVDELKKGESNADSLISGLRSGKSSTSQGAGQRRVKPKAWGL
ncbi:unnamed protein product [Ambrosiozyma monospora]|uniref:Unnamed protein product n=1 Tax=Ambrosiozyma monospora TaxID=43982 RepID=A0ACB5T458_AMBMO|nr:unnamed protein product [Ambrosiozyma monospora]